MLKKLGKNVSYGKVLDHCYYTGKYRGATHSICNLKYIVPNKILVVFHNVSNYDYHFIIKELANKVEGKFEYLRYNLEKYKTFSVPIEKELTKIDKGGSERVVNIFCKTKFVDSARFMATFVDNLTEEIHKIKRKDCGCFFEYKSAKENSIKYKCR